MGVSLSLISEENKKLKNEIAKHSCNEQTLDPYEVYIANEIKPLLNEEEFLVCRGYLDCAKNSVLLHADLDPHDILSQVHFYKEHGWNKNEGVLLDIIADYYAGAIVEFTNDSYGYESYLYPEEIERILNLFITKFYLYISDGGIDEVVHGHEASYVRSPKGLAKLFSHALFESEQVRTRLKIFNDERFYKLVNLYFFDLVAYNIEEYQLYIDSIIADTLSK